MKRIYLHLSFAAIMLIGAASIYLTNSSNEYTHLLKMNQEAMASRFDFEYDGPGTILDPDADGINENPGYLGKISADCDGIQLGCGYFCKTKPNGQNCGAMYKNDQGGGPARNLRGHCGCGSEAR